MMKASKGCIDSRFGVASISFIFFVFFLSNFVSTVYTEKEACITY